MKKCEKRDRLRQIEELLSFMYPDAKCSLEFEGDPWKLLIMGRLSAQCTDERVNIVSKELFRRFPTAEAMAEGELSEIEELVKPCGLYHMKAKSIKEASQMLVSDYNGVLPDTMEELLRFSGVGRKIANLLLGDIFKKSAIVTDTHCIRICGRFGMYPESEKNPYKIEKILASLATPETSSDLCHRLVLFGREICSARSPKCDECKIGEHGLCEHRNKERAKAEKRK